MSRANFRNISPRILLNPIKVKIVDQIKIEQQNDMCDMCDYSPSPGSENIPRDQSKYGAGPRRTEKRRNLRGLQLNADGINTKMAELNSLVEVLDVDVILIQETRLTNKSKTPVLHGYTAVSKDRPNMEFPGGGLLTYVKIDYGRRTKKYIGA